MRTSETHTISKAETLSLFLQRIHQFTMKCIQYFLSIPSNVALYFTTSHWLERLFLHPRYQLASQLHTQNLPEVSQTELQIVEQLETSGIFVSSLKDLNILNTTDFLDAATKLSTELHQSATRPINQNRHTLTANSQQLLKYSGIFRFGLNSTFLRIIERYLKQPVAYDGLSYYFSIANGIEKGPRKWHRDKEDWRMIKVCVYLNDVDETGGPIEAVHPDHNRLLTQACHPYQVLNHDEAKQLLQTDREDWYGSYLGTTGTVIFIDTARFYHRGKPPIEHHRSAVFFSYFGDRPKNPFFCSRSPFSRQELRQLAHILPNHQRKSVLWKDYLPGIGRWIPKNRVTV